MKYDQNRLASTRTGGFGFSEAIARFVLENGQHKTICLKSFYLCCPCSQTLLTDG